MATSHTPNTSSEALREVLERFKRDVTHAGSTDGLVSQMMALSSNEKLEARKQLGNYVSQSLKPAADAPEDVRIKWLQAEATLLHMDMFLLKGALFGPYRIELSKDVPIVTEFVKRCLGFCKKVRQHTKKLLKTANDPGNKACVMAAIILNQLALTTGKQCYFIQAACLMEFITRCCADKDLIVMQVTAYRILGLGSLALKAYKALEIKGILCESMCPMYFTRIGASMPTENPATLYNAFERALEFYGDAMSKITDYTLMSMAHKNHVSACNVVELHDRLVNSLSRRMLIYERKRIARLTGVAVSGPVEDYYKVEASIKCVARCNSRTPYHCGLFKNQWLISNDYIHWLKAVDDVHEAIRSKDQRFTDLTVTEATVLLDDFTCPLKDIDKFENLLDVEKSASVFALRLIRVLCRLRIKDAESSNKVVPLWRWIEAITQWMSEQAAQYGNYPLLEKNIESQPFPELKLLHKIYILAEAFQTASILATKINSFTKVKKALSRDEARKINASGREMGQKAITQLNILKASAARWTIKLTAITADDAAMLKIARLQGHDVESKPGVALVDLIGLTAIKHDVRRMIQSCHSSLEAIKTLKVPEI